jgi:hypothetical protein
MGAKNQELEETKIEKHWFSIPSSYPVNQFLSPKNTTNKCGKKKPRVREKYST